MADPQWSGEPSCESPAPREVWQRLFVADPYALVTQSPAWTDGVVAAGSYQDASRCYTFPSGAQAVLPLVVAKKLGAGLRGAGSMPAS